ncbi:unnamed protein product [Rotaria sp. Silwood1]|nr:unnamed protein product [Rotaria sp. Silwood1]CAF4619451.1 unnamed protein product [Rotaria sp. Silwood1]
MALSVHRISVMTFNMWKVSNYPGNWPHRRLPLLECLTTFTPDILCVQELHPLFHDLIVEALPSHAYIKDDFAGWQNESNIYWNGNLFDIVEYGIIDIGMKETLRRLFWVLLKVKTLKLTTEEQTKSEKIITQQILIATAHYTWEGHAEEHTTNINLRQQQAQRTATALHALQSKFGDPHLAMLFMGDLNENFHPRRILREAGFIDCFSALRLPCLPTHPQRPSTPKEDFLGDCPLDWITQNNYARPILANVLRNLICTGGYSVSDHCPVMCIYEIGSGPNNKDYNLIINFDNNESPLKTPPLPDLYNIVNNNKNFIFDSEVESDLPSVLADTSTEIQPTITSLENQVPSHTTINDFPSQPSLNLQDVWIEYSEQETFQNDEHLPTTETIHSETNESIPDLEEFWRRGVAHENNTDPIVEEPTDQQISSITDFSTVANDHFTESENQQEHNTSLINNLYLPLQSSSNEISQNTLINTEACPSGIDVIPYGYLLHPIAPKTRVRYERELINNKMSGKMAHIKDYFGESSIFIGPDSLFTNRHLEISLLSKTPDNRCIYSRHTFYSPNMPDAKKFSNPIYLESNQLDVECNFIKLKLMIAKKCQQDLLRNSESDKQYHWTKTPKCTIKYYPSGEENSIDITPRQFNKTYQLDNLVLGIRPVELQPDGVSYLTTPNSPVIISNIFIGVNSDDSPTTWNYHECQLKIVDMKIINEDVSFNENNRCIIQFLLEIPQLYHCTLKSGFKLLEVSLITNDDLSYIYKIAFENDIQNPAYFKVNIDSINLQLTIIKERLSNQQQIHNGLQLKPLSNQDNITDFNHFFVRFCLQDVGMNNFDHPKSYSHSIVQSMELIDINESINMMQTSYPENNELQQNYYQ